MRAPGFSIVGVHLKLMSVFMVEYNGCKKKVGTRIMVQPPEMAVKPAPRSPVVISSLGSRLSALHVMRTELSLITLAQPTLPLTSHFAMPRICALVKSLKLRLSKSGREEHDSAPTQLDSARPDSNDLLLF